jgi:hypothetical protein
LLLFLFLSSLLTEKQRKTENKMAMKVHTSRACLTVPRLRLRLLLTLTLLRRLPINSPNDS